MSMMSPTLNPETQKNRKNPLKNLRDSVSQWYADGPDINHSLTVAIQYEQPIHPGQEIMKNGRRHTY
jgi:hypothetical protein